MKKLLSILIATFFLSNIVTYAQKENNPFTEIALTQAKRKDPISKGDTPISRSIIQTANAYLYNNTVCVDFNEVLPNVTITLINESTSKLIHSEAYNEPTNIDITLDEGYSSGNYLIKIESDEVLLYGYFSLCGLMNLKCHILISMSLYLKRLLSRPFMLLQQLPELTQFLHTQIF